MQAVGDDAITYRSRDKPVDVSDVEDLTGDTGDLGAASLKLDSNWSVAQVGCHGEVGNGGSESDGGSDVVKDAFFTFDQEAQSEESDCRGGHDTSDSPVPIRAMGGDVDVGRLIVIEHVRVHVQRVVAGSLFDAHLD